MPLLRVGLFHLIFSLSVNNSSAAPFLILHLGTGVASNFSFPGWRNMYCLPRSLTVQSTRHLKIKSLHHTFIRPLLSLASTSKNVASLCQKEKRFFSSEVRKISQSCFASSHPCLWSVSPLSPPPRPYSPSAFFLVISQNNAKITPGFLGNISLGFHYYHTSLLGPTRPHSGPNHDSIPWVRKLRNSWINK